VEGVEERPNCAAEEVRVLRIEVVEEVRVSRIEVVEELACSNVEVEGPVCSSEEGEEPACSIEVVLVCSSAEAQVRLTEVERVY